MHEETGLVSCITPVYNGEAYIGRLLESVLGQTYPKLEMILADDGSEDGTVEAAERYRERFEAKGWRFRIVRGAHRNAAAALNRGLRLAAGEYLIWPDSDDVLEPASTARRAEFLAEHPEYGCVRSLMYYFDADGRPLPPAEPFGELREEHLFWDVLEGRTFVCCGCYMLRAGELWRIYPDRRIPESTAGQNFQMLLPYLYRHRCATIEERLYGVCRHPGSHSQRRLTQAQEVQKYREFKRLADQISGICGLRLWERRRVLCWKLEYRLWLARKHGNRAEELKAKLQLSLCGRNRLVRGLRETLRKGGGRR